MAAPFDSRMKNSRAHPSVWQPAVAGGAAIPDHKKMHNIGSPGRDGGDVCIRSCILGNFTISWSFGRRGVVFKTAILEKSAK